MFDFTHIIDFIFKKQSDYKKLSNEDKEKFFFIINRKMARMYPVHAQFLNKKYIDKSNSMDIWFNFFVKKGSNGIPNWYWGSKKKTTKEKSIIKKDEIEFLKKLYDIKENDIQFLIDFFPEELLQEVKKIRKFDI